MRQAPDQMTYMGQPRPRRFKTLGRSRDARLETRLSRPTPRGGSAWQKMNRKVRFLSKSKIFGICWFFFYNFALVGLFSRRTIDEIDESLQHMTFEGKFIQKFSHLNV
jgi:hypothetical protein